MSTEMMIHGFIFRNIILDVGVLIIASMSCVVLAWLLAPDDVQ